MTRLRTDTSVKPRYVVSGLLEVSTQQLSALSTPAPISEVSLGFSQKRASPVLVRLALREGLCSEITLSQENVSKRAVRHLAEDLSRWIGAACSDPITYPMFKGERHQLTLRLPSPRPVGPLVQCLEVFFEGSSQIPEVRFVMPEKASPAEFERLGFSLLQMNLTEVPPSPGSSEGPSRPL